ncbi:hypothetical protein [Microbulbifer elongatus]|uniref:hypothetical protein n=1 Tax=Microbulbifer elongatus TaxID=86173 RepID=UPI001CFD1389|nr:hypothetical protein [Microbulbifer elongatus]
MAELIPVSYYGDQFWGNFPKTKMRLLKESSRPVAGEIEGLFPDAIVDVEENNLDLEFDTPKFDKNSIRMLYKRWRCNEIKKKVERNYGEKFDVVVVTRPDLLLHVNLEHLQRSKFKLPKIDEVFVPSANTRDGITNDVLAYGASKAMDDYCSLFYKVAMPSWHGIHKELARHLADVGLSERQAELIQSNGIERGKLLSYEDIKGDNAFIDDLLAHCSNNSEVNPDWSSEERASFYSFVQRKQQDEGLHKDRFYSLIKGDLSLIECNDFSKDRGKYVLDSFLSNIEVLKLTSESAIIDFIPERLRGEKLDRNLKRLFQTKKFQGYVKAQYIIDCFERRDIASLCSDFDVRDVHDVTGDIADKYRDFALELENVDLDSAFKLMKIALSIRPGGPFIKKKLEEYSRKLELEI